MNTELIALIVKNNSADLEAIIEKVGIINLITLIPHLLEILKTVQNSKTT